MSPEKKDLDWLAFRYVIGETDAGEAANCEELLLESQPFREAVARSVELVGAASFALSKPQPTKTPATASRRLFFTLEGVVLGVAASFLFTVSLISAGWLIPRSAVPSVPSATLSEEADPDLALHWLDHLQRQSSGASLVDAPGDSSTTSDASASMDWMNAVAQLPAQGGMPE